MKTQLAKFMKFKMDLSIIFDKKDKKELYTESNKLAFKFLQSLLKRRKNA